VCVSRAVWSETETCRSNYTNVLIVSFNSFMLIKCAFVGHKNFDIYRNARYYNNKNLSIKYFVAQSLVYLTTSSLTQIR
jgi:hypothetical protein